MNEPRSAPDPLDVAGVAWAHVDRVGVVTRSNAAWRHVVTTRSDYLAVCRESEDSELVAFADDLTHLLKGEVARVERVYANHTATAARWFRAEAEATEEGATIAHLDVTRQRIAEGLLEIQVRVTRLLSERVSLADACVEIVHAICDGLAWDLAAVWMREEHGFRGTAVVAGANEQRRGGQMLDRFAALTRDTVVEEGVGVVGRACQTRVAAWETLAPNDTRERKAAAYALGMRAVLVVPFVYDDLVPAAIELYARVQLPVDRDLLHLLQLAGLQLAGEETRRSADRRATLAEQKERTLQAELNAVLACAPAAIAAIDRSGRVLFVNAAWERTVVGTDWRTLIPAAEHEDAERCFINALAGGDAQSYETMRPRDGSPHWFTTHIGPLREGAGVIGAVLFVTDVTSRKSREAEVLESQKLATVGTIAAGVAHEINNPLAYIMANLDFSSRQLQAPLDEPTRAELIEVLAEARQGAERIHKVVRDLRTFSRSDAEARGEIDVNAVLESTINLAWNEIRHRGRMVKQLGTLPRVVGNEARLGQVFLNLLLNAAQALPEGTHDQHEIRVSSLVEDGAVIVDIGDTGHGIAPQDLERIFEPFFTTRPAGKGTGLGLTISRTILQSFNGQLTVSSALGKGATFRIRIPLPVELRVVDVPAVPVSTPAARSRILIVDDEVAVARALKRMLAAHECELSPSAEHALQRLRDGEDFDVVFCDMMMPQMTGAQLHAIIAVERPALAKRMVFVTGGAFGGETEAFLERIENPRLDKPFDAASVAAALARVLAQRTS